MIIRFLVFGGRWLNPALVSAALSLIPSLSFGQSGGIYDLTHTAISGGGAFSTGGSYRIGSSIGQPIAGSSSGGIYTAGGGFWGGGELVPALTPTATVAETTALATLTPTMPAEPTTSIATPTPSVAVAVATNTPSRSPTRSQSPSTTSMVTATATASPTPTPPLACAGDCNQSGRVTVDELIRGVNILLGHADLAMCPSFDANDTGTVTVDELVAAVNRALKGC